MSSPTAKPNRLAQSTSPYLRQHAHNPVEWYPWGPEALERARREDRPIFLSIGYAACHWCHVMAHESFENPEIAALLNQSFVNIKVDREERPDIDELYMQATLVLNQGQGGWPMSVWLTPALKPFFAGTYFPPSARYGRAGFLEICQSITRAWRQHREDIVGHAEQLTEVVRGSLAVAPPVSDLALATVDAAAEVLANAFDTVSGGIVSGGTNKFPPSMALDLLLRSAVRRAPGTARRQQLVQLVELTLEHMAAGGIYDQLGGGIHRYSTDVEWHVPHFEKMLYDQALVARSYLDAWQLTGKPLYARIATEICGYVLADLQAPDGGFYSARDADSEGVEGRYYVWTKDQVQAALGEEAELFCAHYDVRQGGNWRDPHAPDEPKNVLRELRSYDCCGKMLGLPREECARRLQSARAKLLEVRHDRTPPALDDKILCEWNGLMIASLARTGAVLERPEFVQAAARAAEFILAHQWRDGRLRRSWRAGQTLELAFLADYAALIDGLLELYEATFAWRWIEQAVALNDVVCAQFLDREHGAFFFTPHDHEPLLTRSKDARDGAVPSGNALQVMNLLRLAALFDDRRLRALAEHALRALSGTVQAAPWAAERLLAAVDFAHAGPVEIAIVGDLHAAPTQALLRAVHRTYLPNRVLVATTAGARPPTPLLAERPQLNGEPAAYVCRAGTCHPPVTRLEDLITLLSSAPV